MSISEASFQHEIAALFDQYKPNSAVLAQLGTIDLTTVSAPTGMGKDTLIDASGVYKVLSETVRPPRLNCGVMERSGVEYEFRGEELDNVLDDVRHGRHVQIGIGPGRNMFYGSRIANYPKAGPALIAVLTSQVDTMRSLPFASVEPVFVTAPNYETWRKRLAARGTLTADDWSKRQQEAIRSLEDGLDDERYVFICNDEITVASRALATFASTREYDHHASKRARNAANAVRQHLLTT